MEDRKESNGWLSVPAFGDWDQKHGVPDYSVDFSKIRENRKQNKSDFSRVSVGNEEELISNHRRDSDNPSGDALDSDRPRHHPHSPTPRRKILSYFNCCISS